MECDYLNGWTRNGHIRKNLTQDGEAQRYSWGTQKKKKGNLFRLACLCLTLRECFFPQYLCITAREYFYALAVFYCFLFLETQTIFDFRIVHWFLLVTLPALSAYLPVGHFSSAGPFISRFPETSCPVFQVKDLVCRER